MISAVAQRYQIHPQTLRLYEREGLLKPSRTEGNTRLYSQDDLDQLETILGLPGSQRSPKTRFGNPATSTPESKDARRSPRESFGGVPGTARGPPEASKTSIFLKAN